MKKLLLLTFIGTFFLYGCQKKDYNYDNNIVNSKELSEFIIAAADLKQSLKTFEGELSRVDLDNLEIVIVNGKEVKYLPASIRNLNIEKKTLLVNQLKEALVNKYPEFGSIDLDNFEGYVDRCIAQSPKVSEFLLDNDINNHLPLTKNSSETTYTSQQHLVGHLYHWALSPAYVEVTVLHFRDRTYMVIENIKNTPNASYTSGVTTYNNKHYYQGKEISTFSHTHRDSYNPSAMDMQSKLILPYCYHSIYYNGAFWSY